MVSEPPKKKPKKAKRARVDTEELERIDSLSWNPSLPQNDDPFSLFVGSDDNEGGSFNSFLSFIIVNLCIWFKSAVCFCQKLLKIEEQDNGE